MVRVLIVDDEPGIRRLLRVTLGQAYQVEEAADGAAALRRLLVDSPDIVILDVAMPILDGLAVCRAARAEPALAGLGIIVLSANVGAAEALAAGADRALPKPFRPLELLGVIDELVTTRRIAAAIAAVPGRRSAEA
jgi:CheY-like chemotaxis protein